jgi:hypothetical protein
MFERISSASAKVDREESLSDQETLSGSAIAAERSILLAHRSGVPSVSEKRRLWFLKSAIDSAHCAF